VAAVFDWYFAAKEIICESSSLSSTVWNCRLCRHSGLRFTLGKLKTSYILHQILETCSENSGQNGIFANAFSSIACSAICITNVHAWGATIPGGAGDNLFSAGVVGSGYCPNWPIFHVLSKREFPRWHLWLLNKKLALQNWLQSLAFLQKCWANFGLSVHVVLLNCSLIMLISVGCHRDLCVLFPRSFAQAYPKILVVIHYGNISSCSQSELSIFYAFACW